MHPLFELLANAEARKSQGATRPTHNMALVYKKKNTPYVEYTRGDVDPANGPQPSKSACGSNAAASSSTGLQVEQSTNQTNPEQVVSYI